MGDRARLLYGNALRPQRSDFLREIASDVRSFPFPNVTFEHGEHRSSRLLRVAAAGLLELVGHAREKLLFVQLQRAVCGLITFEIDPSDEDRELSNSLAMTSPP